MTPATILEHDGIQQSIIEWALDYGITPGIIIARLERGLSIADAITTPMKIGYPRQRLPVFCNEQVNSRSRHVLTPTYTVNGITKTLQKWAEGLNLSVSSLQLRLTKGIPLEEALTTPNKTQKKQPNERACADADRQDANSPPGVSDDLHPFEGTGAGKSLQENSNLAFQKEAAE